MDISLTDEAELVVIGEEGIAVRGAAAITRYVVEETGRPLIHLEEPAEDCPEWTNRDPCDAGNEHLVDIPTERMAQSYYVHDPPDDGQRNQGSEDDHSEDAEGTQQVDDKFHSIKRRSVELP